MKILILTGFTLPDVSEADLTAIAEAAGPGATLTVARDRQAALAAAPEAEVILGSPSEELFLAAPRLRWVQATASGVDSLLFPAMKASAIPLTGEKGLVGPHLADHAMALLLALTRKLAEAVRDGPASWERRMDYRRREIELEGLTLGIVGFGGTGRALARRAASFDMRIRALDREAMAGSPEVAVVEPLTALPDLLGASDVAAICAPLTTETAGGFDRDCFAAMKPGAIVLNVTRGEIIDQTALVEALESGHLGGAGLDVFHREPLPADDPLWGFPNVVMTPHTAGASQLRAGRTLRRFVENLGRLRRDEPLDGLIDKELGY